VLLDTLRAMPKRPLRDVDEILESILDKLRASSLVHKEIAKRLGIKKRRPRRTAARAMPRAR
jgi:hypothetical protein